MSLPEASLSLADVSELLTIGDRRVQQLVKEGVIPKARRGAYALVPAVQGYIRYLRDRVIGGDLPTTAVGGHKERLLKARADIAEMDAERQAGQLIPAEEVTRTWVEAVARCRAKLLAVPTKAAPLVAGETGIDACHETIETLIHEALAELAATEVQVDVAPGDRRAARGAVQRVDAAAEANGQRVG